MSEARKNDSYYHVSRPEIACLIDGRPTRILEIGCAAGTFKNNIKWPCEYHGVEPFMAAAKEAEDNDIIVHKATYDEVKDELPNNYFDLVVANDVMEHMSDPSSFLTSIREKLAVGGCFIGSVPNVRYITNLFNLICKRDWQYTHAGVLDSTHLRFFTPKSLRKTLLNHGFSIKRLRPSGPHRFLWLKRLLAIFVWPIGYDCLFMQISFKVTRQQSPIAD